MNSYDAGRVKRICEKLDAAAEVFRRSSSKPAIVDIDMERRLNLLDAELRKLVKNETKSRMVW